MHATVNPEMLILGRELRGFSQSRLAQAASINQGVLSRYETGVRDCTEQDLTKISQALNLPVQFFYRHGRIYGPESSNLYHRKRQSVSATKLRTIYARLNRTRLDVERLLASVDFEPLYSFPQYNLDEADDISMIAAQVRATWRLPAGPIRSVITAIEDAGGIVIPVDFGTTQIDAVVQWIPPMYPVFLINESAPGERLRFTLAHEIGHLVMHNKPTPEMEDQADAFASAFLMPEPDIRRDLDRPTLAKLTQLKSYWRVSIQALARRAKDLGKINERQYRYLFEQLSKAGYRLTEPNPLPPEQPTLFRDLLNIHLTELQYSIRELAQMLTVDENELTEIYFGQRPRLKLVSHRGHIGTDS